MKSNDNKTLAKKRQERNSDLLKRMRDGDPLRGYDSFASWFPPRPIVKKDRKLVEKLYSISEAEPKS